MMEARVYAKFDGVNYTDISEYVKNIKIDRGRNYEFDRMEAGTCVLTLDNGDQRFTPGLSPRPQRINHVYRPTSRGGYPFPIQSPYAGLNFEGKYLVPSTYSPGQIGYSNFYEYRVPAGSGNIRRSITPPASTITGLTAGDPITFRMMTRFVKYNSTLTPFWQVSFLNSSNAVVQTITENIADIDEWSMDQVLRTLITPSGATQARLDAIYDTGASVTVGSSGYILGWQDVYFGPGLHADYFDGDSDGCRWEGDKYVTRSIQDAYTPAYWPNVKEGVRIKVVQYSTTLNVEFPIFQGIVERWPVQIEPGTRNVVEVTAIDALAQLAQAKLPSAYIAEHLIRKPVIYCPFNEDAKATTVSSLGSWEGVTGEVINEGTNIGALGAPGLMKVGDPSGKSFEIQSLATTSPDNTKGTAVRITMRDEMIVDRTKRYRIAFVWSPTSVQNRSGSTLGNTNEIIASAYNANGGMTWAVTYSHQSGSQPQIRAGFALGYAGQPDAHVSANPTRWVNVALPFVWSGTAPGDVFYFVHEFYWSAADNAWKSQLNMEVISETNVTRSSGGESIENMTDTSLMTPDSSLIGYMTSRWKYFEIGNPISRGFSSATSDFSTTNYMKARYSHFSVFDLSAPGADTYPYERDNFKTYMLSFYDNVTKDATYMALLANAAGCTPNFTYPSESPDVIQIMNFGAGTNGLDELNAIMNSTMCIAYPSIDQESTIVLKTRAEIESGRVRLVIDCAGRSQPEMGLKFEKDYEQAASEVQVTGMHNNTYTKVRKIDGSVVSTVKTLSIESRLKLAADVDALADYYANQVREARVRCDSVTLDMTTMDGTTDTSVMFTQNPGAIVRMTNLPASAPSRQMDFVVQGIRWDIAAQAGTQTQSCTYQLSPIEPYKAFALDSSGNSTLDGGINLAL